MVDDLFIVCLFNENRFIPSFFINDGLIVSSLIDYSLIVSGTYEYLFIPRFFDENLSSFIIRCCGYDKITVLIVNLN